MKTILSQIFVASDYSNPDIQAIFLVNRETE